MTRRPVEAQRPAPDAPVADFHDVESQRVLAAITRALAIELGRQSAREVFARRTGTEPK